MIVVTSPVPYPTAAMTAWRDRMDPVGAMIRRLADANTEARDVGCLTSAYPTSGGWAYRCLCGYESHPRLTAAQARTFAAAHEATR